MAEGPSFHFLMRVHIAAAPPMPPAITAIAMIVFFPNVLAFEVLGAAEDVGRAPTVEVTLTVPLAVDLLAIEDVWVFVLIAIVGVVADDDDTDEKVSEEVEDTLDAVLDTT